MFRSPISILDILGEDTAILGSIEGVAIIQEGSEGVTIGVTGSVRVRKYTKKGGTLVESYVRNGSVSLTVDGTYTYFRVDEVDANSHIQAITAHLNADELIISNCLSLTQVVTLHPGGSLRIVRLINLPKLGYIYCYQSGIEDDGSAMFGELNSEQLQVVQIYANPGLKSIRTAELVPPPAKLAKPGGKSITMTSTEHNSEIREILQSKGWVNVGFFS